MYRIVFSQKFTGGPFGITTKIPKSSFTVTAGHGAVKVHEADNGGGVVLHREFCNDCGSGILEYGVGLSRSTFPDDSSEINVLLRTSNLLEQPSADRCCGEGECR